MPSVSYDTLISEMYADDPVAALETLRSTLEEGEAAELVIVHEQLKKAFRGEIELTETGAKGLIEGYRGGMKNGELPLSLLIRTMRKLGLKLVVAPVGVESAVLERDTAA